MLTPDDNRRCARNDTGSLDRIDRREERALLRRRVIAPVKTLFSADHADLGFGGLPRIFPWRTGHQLALLIDGPVFFSRILAAMDLARSHILIEFYLVESGMVVTRFVDALVRAKQRGVAVRLLFDDFGARGLLAADRDRLKTVGIELNFYNPIDFAKGLRNLLRDHRKLVVIDGRIAYVGGAGLTDAFADRPQSWRETMIEIAGPVALDWQDLFLRTWKRATRKKLILPSPTATFVESTDRARVIADWGFGAHAIVRSVIERLDQARVRAWIATAYFVPTSKLRRALRRAARRGIDVRLLLPGPTIDHPPVRHVARRFYGRLLRNGVRIFEYQPRFLHAKAVICDHWTSIGSCNLDRWNLRWNLEANQEVEDPSLAAQVTAMFESDFQQSFEYTFALWQARPWWNRVLEHFWSAIVDWLQRLRHGGGR